jgi:hypothetical protein
MHKARTSCCGISSQAWVKRVLDLAKIICFLHPSLGKVYFQAKQTTGLRSGDEAEGSKNPARFVQPLLSAWPYEMAQSLDGSKNNLLHTSSGLVGVVGLVKRV